MVVQSSHTVGALDSKWQHIGYHALKTLKALRGCAWILVGHVANREHNMSTGS